MNVAMTSDPVNGGFVPSMSRPGGNITGVSIDAGLEIWGKRLELFREIDNIEARDFGTRRALRTQQNVIGRSTLKLRPGTLAHASLIARSTGRSFSFYAELESAHAMRST